MNAHIRQVMTDSAQDFRALVWPRIASTPLVNGGEIRPVVDRVFPFAALNDAMAYIDTGRAKGKVVVSIR